MKQNVIITGITGQDGTYLAKLLLEKGYNVIGTTRSYSSDNFKKAKILGVEESKVKIEVCDLTDYSSIYRLLDENRPSMIFNLAAQSSVFNSFQQPIGTIDFNIKSTLNFLEIIRGFYPNIKFYQAVSSEIFGNSNSLPITEKSILNPQSPYAISKATDYMLVKLYRESYNLKVCSGILFNHESILRDNNFFIKKLIENAVKIKNNQLDKLILGNLKIKRDFGYSPLYVEAMYKMLFLEKYDDYIICSGKSFLLENIVFYVLDKLNLSKEVLVIDPSLFRPSEIEEIYGDNSKAKHDLNWNYDYDFFKVIDEMIDFEINSKYENSI
jgi:GDPmannose 4,6-dehydratase